MLVSLCFLNVDTLCPAVSSFCYPEFPSMMEHTLELGATKNSFSPVSYFSEYFITVIGKETKADAEVDIA